MEERKELTAVVRSDKVGRARGRSVGCIEELWKRKREEEEEQKVFNKSKKMPR